jgi:ribonuclease P protein component
VLPAPSRLRRRPDFAAAVRHGRRVGRARLVVHLDVTALDATPLASAQAAAATVSDDAGSPPRVGFVVGRAVGDAVTRNRVKRRLRHVVRDRLSELPSGARVVVRALPPAAEASSAELARDLESALARAIGRSA